MESKPAFFLSITITLVIALNVYLLTVASHPQRELVTVARVIDGDTLELSTGETVRLENINTPEKNQPGFETAKQFLAQFQNQTIEIEKTGIDKYKRTLAKIYTPNYLNLEIVEKGLAKKYLVDDSETKLFANAEKNAIELQAGNWKQSEHNNCISSEIFPKEFRIMLKNSCEINVKDFKLTGESRKNYNFAERYFSELNIHLKQGENNATDIFITDLTFNQKRDTVYLFDANNNLVHYHSYGY